ncbi:MAG TPA: NAD-dependent epimerase/dehydratase family protein [Actinomycetota bacterium]|nr:NAD-dependent epimerase/dehydratase family protein [Actinomycetota bacterium]
MDTTGRRVLVTGASRYLGLRCAARLAADERVDALFGVDLTEPVAPVPRMEFVRADIRSPLVARLLDATGVDTIVHTNVSSTTGAGRREMKETNVIGTMQLLAAAQHAEHVTRVVVKSSTAVYGAAPGDPSILTEDHAARHARLSGYAKDCADAEAYARDLARRRPDIAVAVLRTGSVAGPTVRTSMTQYLSLPVVPTALGYDPRLQLLHEDDAADALHTAATSDCRGAFNVSGDGVVYLSQAVRMLGRVPLPVARPAGTAAAQLVRALGIVEFPLDQLDVIVHGQVVDTRRARAAFGFAPAYTTAATIEDFRARRAPEPEPGRAPREPWERALFDFLRAKSWEEVTV